MFHKASLKLGLEQAVLRGQSAPGAPADKDAVDLLLKRGAYDLLRCACFPPPFVCVCTV